MIYAPADTLCSAHSSSAPKPQTGTHCTS